MSVDCSERHAAPRERPGSLLEAPAGSPKTCFSRRSLVPVTKSTEYAKSTISFNTAFYWIMVLKLAFLLFFGIEAIDEHLQHPLKDKLRQL
jgi:hypothetical protein